MERWSLLVFQISSSQKGSRQIQAEPFWFISGILNVM